jgi:hypothetical protein
VGRGGRKVVLYNGGLWRGCTRPILNYNENGPEFSEEEVRAFARLLYRALKEDDPNAVLGELGIDSPPMPSELVWDDGDAFDRTTVDGRFNFLKIARRVLSAAPLSRRAPRQ